MNLRILGILTALTLAACKGPEGSSLAGSFKGKDNCPETGCVDTTPSPEKLYLGVNNGQSIQVRRDQKVLEIAGDCSASTYPSNKIVIAFDNNYFQAFYPAFVADGRLEILCRGGRYLVIFNVTAQLTAASFQNIELEIVGLDEQGVEYRSDVGSLQTIQVIRLQ